MFSANHCTSACPVSRQVTLGCISESGRGFLAALGSFLRLLCDIAQRHSRFIRKSLELKYGRFRFEGVNALSSMRPHLIPKNISKNQTVSLLVHLFGFWMLLAANNYSNIPTAPVVSNMPWKAQGTASFKPACAAKCRGLCPSQTRMPRLGTAATEAKVRFFMIFPG